MENQNRYFSCHSLHPDADVAVSECLQQLNKCDWSGEIQLLIVFAAGHATASWPECFTAFRENCPQATVIGSSVQASICGYQEFEDAESSVSVLAAHFASATLDPFHLSFLRVDGGAIVGWPERFDDGYRSDSTLVVIGDPFSFPMESLLERINEDHPGTRVIGGMASSGFQPGQNRLLLNDRVFDEGLVGFRISGMPVTALVSQGCRPIGNPMVITKAERNVIFSLGGKPAYQQLTDLFAQLPTREQRLIQNGLHLGQVIDEYRDTFSFGDFLVRNVVGIDDQDQTITIGDYVRVGQTVQFHVRDAESASAELEQLLKQEDPNSVGGALLFTCNGRGSNLFDVASHDAMKIQQELRSNSSDQAGLPLAGFFAAGEIGPVGGKNFVHGFTASLVMLPSRSDP